MLEEATRLLPPDAVFNEKDQVNVWREMRNRAAHSGGTQESALRVEEVQAMVDGIRRMLSRADEKAETTFHAPSLSDALTRVRGKYAFVQTSVDEFLKRKHDDQELEERVIRNP